MLTKTTDVVHEPLWEDSKTASTLPKLLVATRVFGVSGQPWMSRQVNGLRGWQTELLCWEHRNPELYRAENIVVRILGGNPAPYDGAGRWFHRLRTLPTQNFYAAVGSERKALARLLRQERPAAILCYFGDIAMRVLPVAEREDIPVIAYLHGDFQFVVNRWYRTSFTKCLARFAAFAVVTETERNWLLHNQVSPEKIQIIPCGAPIDVFRPARRESRDRLRFAMVSRLSEDKGCGLSIQAFAAAAAEFKGAQLHIYGDGPERAGLEELVHHLGLTKAVFFHGYVDEASLARELPLLDVFIQHSVRKEGSPVSVAEAMACGLPVVATRVGGIPELVEEGETGLLVDERHVGAMADAMLRLGRDLDLREKMGAAGRDRAVTFFDTAVQTRRLESLVTSVARLES